VNDVIASMLALLQNQKQPPTDDDQIIACITNYQTSAALAKKRNNDREFLSAVQTLMQNLQALSKKDLRDLDDIKLYAYHAGLLKKQQELLAEIDKAFAVASKQIGSFKNSL
jgi:hypothetical protein